MTDRILEVLSKIESLLGDMLDNGISEPLIKVLNRQIKKGRRWLMALLREEIGDPGAEVHKWIAVAMMLVQMARSIIIFRR